MSQGHPAGRQGSPVKRKSIDFRELLETLLPLDSLPPASRLEVQRALHSGITAQIERVALLALRELERQGTLRRIGPKDNAAPPALRYESRQTFNLITVQLPMPPRIEGFQAHLRALLPVQAEARLDRVRTLLSLDDALVFAPPGEGRPGLFEQLDRAGREFLGASEVRFIPATPVESAGETAVTLDEALATATRTHPDTLLYCPDANLAPSLAEAARSRRLRSAAFCSVRTPEGEVLGHLEVMSRERDPFRPAELALVVLLADSVAGVLARAARIETMVFVDPLTSVYNRSYFNLEVQNEMARAQRERASMALLIADIDDFKAFNSVYGYEAGNRVLVEVAQALKGAVRPFDTVARWGGEEFAVVLTSPIHASDVGTITERLRSIVERHAVRLEGLDGASHRVGVTVSVGVAVFPDHASSPPELFRAANQALLEAKKPPKNRVVFAPRIPAAPAH